MTLPQDVQDEDLCLSPSFLEMSDDALPELGVFFLVQMGFLDMISKKREITRKKEAHRVNRSNRRSNQEKEEKREKDRLEKFPRATRDATPEEITGRANRAKLIVWGAKAGLWKLAKPTKPTSSEKRRSQRRRAKAKAKPPTPASPKETATASDSKLLSQSALRRRSRSGFFRFRFSPGES